MKRIRRRKQSMSESMTGKMITTGVGNLVGMGLMGATAGMANALPAGSLASSMAGTTVGLQGVALLGPNLKLVNDSLGGGQRPVRRRVRRRVSRRRY